MVKLFSPTRAKKKKLLRRNSPEQNKFPTLVDLFTEEPKKDIHDNLAKFSLNTKIAYSLDPSSFNKKIEKKQKFFYKIDQNLEKSVSIPATLRQKKIFDILNAESPKDGYKLGYPCLRQTRLRFPRDKTMEEEASKPTVASITTASYISPGQTVDSFSFENLPALKQSRVKMILPFSRPSFQHFLSHFVDAELNEKFCVLKILGQGAFATVRECICRLTKRHLAIKSYNHQNIHAGLLDRAVQNEIRVLRSAKHPNLIELISVMRTRSHTHLVLELFVGKTLEEYLLEFKLGRLCETLCKSIIKQVLYAVIYLHNRKIYHRDLKVENVMINNDGQIKLIDFGFALDASQSSKSPLICGTPNYMAPEATNTIPKDLASAETWSLAVMIYRLVCGEFPFKAEDPNDPRSQLDHFYLRPLDISDALHSLFSSALEIEPSQRIPLENFLNNSWFKNAY